MDYPAGNGNVSGGFCAIRYNTAHTANQDSDSEAGMTKERNSIDMYANNNNKAM